MYLSKVTIKNFRNLRDLTVDLAEGLNVILGENNIGKTNFLDAIRAALGPASSHSDVLRVTKDDRYQAPDGTIVSNAIQIDLWFAGLSDENAAELLEALNLSDAGLSRSTASIHYEWTWSENSGRYTQRRWGGDRPNTESQLPEDVLQAIPQTYLSALRNALDAMSPGRQSRLAQLLTVSSADGDAAGLEAIVKDANDKLEQASLITNVEKRIGRALQGASGTYVETTPLIRASAPQFDKIVASLRLVLKALHHTEGTPSQIQELRSNGLGLNNLIYIAAVIAELDATRSAALPLLSVEEPEAHLHPQLQTLLLDFLSQGGAEEAQPTRVQTIVTSHSPTVAAHVQPAVLQIFHRSSQGDTKCVAVKACDLEEQEARKLRRMLDVTRASMLFARGVIFVEGISEALLLPVLARCMEPPMHLGRYGIAVVPVSGLDFSTFAKLFGGSKLSIPVAIVTDGDPELESDGPEFNLSTARPKSVEGQIRPGSRVRALIAAFAAPAGPRVFHSQVTFEYDLAQASAANATAVFEAWASCYAQAPRTLTKAEFDTASTPEDKALLIWRALCLRAPTHGKADAAQSLAAHLEAQVAREASMSSFVVPQYIQAAIRHVMPGPSREREA